MRRLIPLSVAGVLLAAALAAAGAPQQPFYLGGIQVNEPDHDAWVEALRRAGMNTVEVTVYAHQGDWDSANLWFDDDAPWVVREMRAAKRQGLHVVLVLRVALDHAFERNRFLWHGMIMPRDAETADEWFRRYRRFTIQWSRIAEREGVDVVAVASELNALTNTVPVTELPALEEYWTNPEKVARETEKIRRHAGALQPRDLVLRGGDGFSTLDEYLAEETRRQRSWAEQTTWFGEPDALERINRRRRQLATRWKQLIAAARRVYGGKLTYAANFDQYAFVDFWDRLDLIGINAYFPLRSSYRRGLAEEDLYRELEDGWTEVLESIDAFRRRIGRPAQRVLFTELGYVARANSTLQPWAADGFAVLPAAGASKLVVWRNEPPDRAERALAVAALDAARRRTGRSLLEGVLYWKLSTLPSHRAIEPFVAILGSDDPLLVALARLAEPAGTRTRRVVAALRSLLPGSG